MKILSQVFQVEHSILRTRKSTNVPSNSIFFQKVAVKLAYLPFADCFICYIKRKFIPTLIGVAAFFITNRAYDQEFIDIWWTDNVLNFLPSVIHNLLVYMLFQPAYIYIRCFFFIRYEFLDQIPLGSFYRIIKFFLTLVQHTPE